MCIRDSSNIETALEANNSRISKCKAKISGIEERVIHHTSTVSELIAEQDQRIQELKQQLTRLQSTSTPANQTTYIYKNFDDPNSQLKFYGRDTENPLYFLKNCERDMETIGDSLSEMDKVNYVVRRLKVTAA